MHLTNKIFPVYTQGRSWNSSYKIAADENGEICIVDLITLDTNFEGTGCSESIDEEEDLRKLSNILDTLWSDAPEGDELHDLLKEANNLIPMINEIFPNLNLPLVSEDDRECFHVFNDSIDKILIYKLKKRTPKFNDYFETVFYYYCQYGTESATSANAAYCYPISKVIDEIPEDSTFELLSDIEAHHHYPLISNKIDYNLPANIKFIEKFYGEDLLNTNNGIVVPLNVKRFSNEEINLLIGSKDNAKYRIEFNDSLIGLDHDCYDYGKNMQLFQRYVKKEPISEEFISKAKFIFPTTKYECRIDSHYTFYEGHTLTAYWDVESLIDAGLFSEKFYCIKYGGASLPNSPKIQGLINKMRKLKGLPPIDFNKRYAILNP